MDKITQEEMVVKYKNGASLKGIGREYNVDKATVKKWLIRNGVTIEFRDNGKRLFNLNHNYFRKIDTKKKAYFLGLMFADGYVLSDGYCSGISLISQDRILLEEFSREVSGSEKTVLDIKSKEGCQPQSRVIFKSREFQLNLIDKGCVHRKSLILLPPLNLPENLIKYFIHGYFDGDGCFSKPNWQIVSTRPFCEWVADFLIKNKIISHFHIRPVKDNGTHRLIIWRAGDVLNLFNYFYQEDPSPIFLNRKRAKMLDYLSKRNFSHHNILGDKDVLLAGINNC
jgi:hypothetical protein